LSRDADVVVVGGGVVGLAAAAALARAGRSLVLLERHSGFGREVSARNSQVIHAGIYYPEGSLKARLCVAGREALYARCRREGIPHRRLGKLIAACEPDEERALEALAARGAANGAPRLELLDGAAAGRREPELRARAALLSPETGIVDATALCLSFAAEAERHGALLLTRRELLEIEPISPGWRVAVRDADGGLARLSCAALVNAAGLESDSIAALAGFDVDACGYRLRPCKGDYFALAPGAPLRLRGLVYPLPSGAGLGVHATLDLDGRIRFGPDAEYVERPRYDVDPAKAERFAAALRRLLPRIEAGWLSPESAGVRPRLAGPGEPFRDFVVQEESAAGRPGFVNLIGIESPGLTAAPAIAALVVELLAGL
jgi:D-amino-acid oxidase